MITIIPTAINMVFKGSLPASLAAIGAAINPPMINPAIMGQCEIPNKEKKVAALASVTKNSAMLTDPIT